MIIKPFISIWKHTHFLNKTGFFSFNILLKIRWPIEQNISKLVISKLVIMFGYTRWEILVLTITETCPVPSTLQFCLDNCFYFTIFSCKHKTFPNAQEKNKNHNKAKTKRKLHEWSLLKPTHQHHMRKTVVDTLLIKTNKQMT